MQDEHACSFDALMLSKLRQIRWRGIDEHGLPASETIKSE
jgi:hypothetical protein